MKRDWKVIENIMEHIEKEDLHEYVSDQKYLTELHMDVDDYLGHVRLIQEVGLVRSCLIPKDHYLGYTGVYLKDAYITMSGYDLLDAMRNKTMWTAIKAKAASCGVLLSWEFIKAAIPVVIKEALERGA